MVKKTIGIIGFGNMGGAIVAGLLAKKTVAPKNLVISNDIMPVSAPGVVCTTDNKLVAQKADIIILAVKPQVMDDVLNDLKEEVSHEQLIISIAAGLTIKNYQEALGEEQPIIRAMPNLCAKIGESMTAWVKTAAVNKEQETITREIFRAFGKEVSLEDEAMINDFTVVAGSGPAYVFYLAELMKDAAMQFGFSLEEAKKIVGQTLKGSIDTMMQGSDSPEVLRQQVTSKKGVTEAIFDYFEKKNMKKIFIDGLEIGKKRAEELAT